MASRAGACERACMDDSALRRIGLRDGGTVSARVALPPDHRPGGAPLVVLGHGAGSDMHHPFLRAVQDALAAAGYVAATFNFPYRDAGRHVPDRAPTLARCWTAVLDALAGDPTLRAPWTVIGGRSMGGRIASHVAADGAAVRGLVFLGFPLHPAGRPGVTRADHLRRITVPMLFVQGARDALADATLMHGVLAELPTATLHTVSDGDHSFAVPRRTGRTDADVRAEVVRTVVDWLATLRG